jgi:hypothetical protein
MKRSLAIVLALVIALAAGAPAEEPKEIITKDMIRKVIAIFREEPGSERGRGAASLIVRFAEESPEVEVSVSPAVLPWMKANPAPKYGDILLAAFMAGTIRSELDRGVVKSDAVAGTEQVIETYQKLKKTNPTLRIPEVETFIQLQAQGKLKEHFAAP